MCACGAGVYAAPGSQSSYFHVHVVWEVVVFWGSEVEPLDVLLIKF